MWGGFSGGLDVKESSCNAGDLDSIPGSGRSPEKGMAPHPNILAWRIPWTEEPGGLQSVGTQSEVRQSDTTEYVCNCCLVTKSGPTLATP